MDRRSFLGSMIGGIAAAAAVRTWPFRVYSFPAKPMLASGDIITIEGFERHFKIGEVVTIRKPPRFANSMEAEKLYRFMVKREVEALGLTVIT